MITSDKLECSKLASYAASQIVNGVVDKQLDENKTKNSNIYNYDKYESNVLNNNEEGSMEKCLINFRTDIINKN